MFDERLGGKLQQLYRGLTQQQHEAAERDLKSEIEDEIEDEDEEDLEPDDLDEREELRDDVEEALDGAAYCHSLIDEYAKSHLLPITHFQKMVDEYIAKRWVGPMDDSLVEFAAAYEVLYEFYTEYKEYAIEYNETFLIEGRHREDEVYDTFAESEENLCEVVAYTSPVEKHYENILGSRVKILYTADDSWLNFEPPTEEEVYEENSIDLTHDDVVEETETEITIHTTHRRVYALLERLKYITVGRLGQLVDIIVVDNLGKVPRFSVTYVILSRLLNKRVYVKVQVKSLDRLDSIQRLFASAQWSEREVWDRFGVLITGNSDLRRILTDYGFPTFPLRKDFPLTGFVELRYNDRRKAVQYAPVELRQKYRVFTFSETWRDKIYSRFDEVPGQERDLFLDETADLEVEENEELEEEFQH